MTTLDRIGVGLKLANVLDRIGSACMKAAKKPDCRAAIHDLGRLICDEARDLFLSLSVADESDGDE